jgi:hypothetical protein
MIDRKSKMVSFRLSPDEYYDLRNACASRGVRSVSELARTAMQALIGASATRATVDGQLDDLRRLVIQLSHEIDRLAEKVPTPVNGDRAQ